MLVTLVDDIAAALRLSRALPRFLRHPLTLEESAAAQRRRLQTREAAWLSVMREAVYRHPSSPYRRLLHHAGCEQGDLERLVREDGLEATLLMASSGPGVLYLRIEEFKGRRPVVRGREQFVVARRDLCNPRADVHAFARSGGSRGTGMPVPIDLGFLREQSTNACLMVDARGGDATWRKANWTVPGGGALIMMLIAGGFGRLLIGLVLAARSKCIHDACPVPVERPVGPRPEPPRGPPDSPTPARPARPSGSHPGLDDGDPAARRGAAPADVHQLGRASL